jgi:ribosomal protein S27AE
MAYPQDKQARFEQIIAALTGKFARQPCPRCANLKFELIGEAAIQFQESPGFYVIGGPAIPVAVTACTRCGFISQHALGPLGLAGGAK